VYGGSDAGYGVWGEGGTYGVYGSNSPYGVYGSGSSYGVFGTGTSYGVYGTSVVISGVGVYGQNTTNSSSGQLATNVNGGPTGVYGSGSTYGVYGHGTGGSGSTGVYGDGASFGVFAYGNLGATGTKPAVVALPDNRVVELYAMESPENWFEDFGSGQLHDGVAEIMLDPTFALAANTEPGYHVFLTPYGDCEGLYVAQKTATGFQVRELRGGKSNITFDYRIVAKRRGYESLRMDQLESDPETVQAIRAVVQNRPAHRKLILHKPAEAPKAPQEPPKFAAPGAAPAVVMPMSLEPPKLLTPPAPPKPLAPPALPKAGAAPAVVITKPPEAAKLPAAPAPPQ